MDGNGSNGTRNQTQTRNQLSLVEHARLQNALVEMWGDITRERLTYGEAAERATKKLGFPVTLGNVSGAAEVLLDTKALVWPTAKPEKPPEPMEARVAELESKCAALEFRLSLLERELGVAKPTSTEQLFTANGHAGGLKGGGGR